MIDYKHLKFTTAEAEQVIFDLYGISGKAIPLPGEIDFNYRIKIENQDGYILKISRPDEDEAYLDFQINLLQHVAKTAPNLGIPKVIRDKKTTVWPK
ncbi:hypothetical protein [Maribacter halichondriae]|uniref:hypothetical protein n=1 Tax=Maribacter halichondriae TaxID=2980554 RepID=UPI0023587BF0|nr:hypothetical protein [Maribacter sp. Hal144]